MQNLLKTNMVNIWCPTMEAFPGPNEPLHPNGQALITIGEATTVYQRVIPIYAFVESRGLPRRLAVTMETKVTPRQVRRAEQWLDHEEALSVLEAIDTQWGMCPWGGMLDVAGGGSD